MSFTLPDLTLYGAAAFFVAGVAGLVVGIAARGDGGRRVGLRLVQFGFGLGGLLQVARTMIGADPNGWAYGLAALVFATGVTAFRGRSRT